MQLAGFRSIFLFIWSCAADQIKYLEHTFDEQFVTGKEKVEPEHALLHVNNKGIFLAKLTYFKHGLGTLDLMVTFWDTLAHVLVFLSCGLWITEHLLKHVVINMLFMNMFATIRSVGPLISLWVCTQIPMSRLVFHLKCKVTLMYIYSVCVFWVFMPLHLLVFQDSEFLICKS